MPDLKNSDMTPLTTVDGDLDFGYIYDASESVVADRIKRVASKHLTGGMLAHDVCVNSIYHFSYYSSAAASYRKIATLPASTSSKGDKLFISLYISESTAINHAKFEIILGNRTTLTERVSSLSVLNTTRHGNAGIRTYIEGDGSVSVYLYDDGTTYCGLSARIHSTGYGGIATIIPPNKVTSITSPTGTLSLDTTAAPYSNGVPDGNEDWNTLTVVGAGWSNVSGEELKYRRHANGLVEVRGYLNYGTLGVVIATMPAGYRPAAHSQRKILATDSTPYARGYVTKSTGAIVVSHVSSAPTNVLIDFTYMAEQ